MDAARDMHPAWHSTVADFTRTGLCRSDSLSHRFAAHVLLVNVR